MSGQNFEMCLLRMRIRTALFCIANRCGTNGIVFTFWHECQGRILETKQRPSVGDVENYLKIARVGNITLVRNWTARATNIFKRDRKIAISFVMSVCPLRTTGIPLDGFSCKLIFVDLSNCRENSSFITT